MKEIELSIIIPAYNVEQYIRKCLKSIAEQDYSSWEAIVIDDGSTDGTGLICDEFSRVDERFRVFHCENKGVCLARNFALEKATGSIICFVDADDYLCEDALAIILKHFDDPETDAVYSGHYRVDENDNVIETRNGFNVDTSGSMAAVEYTLREGKKSYLGVLWNKSFRRRCIYEGNSFIKFDPMFKIGEDQVWLLQVCKNIRRVEFEAKPVYNYRIRSGSAAHSFNMMTANQSEIAARRQMVSIVEDNYMSIANLAKVKYRTCLNGMIMSAVKRKDLKTVRYLSEYGKNYFCSVFTVGLSLKRVVKEMVLQMFYVILSLGGNKNEN